MYQVTNENGRVFNIRVVKRGEKYGLDDCLVHNEDDPLVEFWDATYTNKNGFGERGQFVGHYYLNRTLLKHDARSGILLWGTEPVWTVSARNVADAVWYAMQECCMWYANLEPFYTEGWGLFLSDTRGIEIQRIDERNVFDGDETALSFVAMRAFEGSMIHAAAAEAHYRNMKARQAEEEGAPDF